MSPARRSKLVLVVVGLAAGGGLVLGALFAALNSPALLGGLAGVLGYEVSAHALSVSPRLSGSIAGLRVARRRDDTMTLLAAQVTARASLPRMLRGEVDSLVLQSPRLTLRIGKGQPVETDLSFLERLPGVRQLDVQDGQALITFEASPRRVELTRANLSVRDYSARTGGRVAFRTDFAVTTGGTRAVAATGTMKGDFALTGGYPRPYGRGTMELVVASGTYTGDGQTIPLSGLTLSVEMAYDRGTETFAVTALRGQSKGFGVITGTGQAVLRGEVPWRASLSAAAIDVAQAFTAIKPFLPEDYRGWTMQGQGDVQTRLQGTYAKGQLALDGSATVSFRRAGMSSPDGSKAAQGVGGKLVLRLRYGTLEEKLSFGVRWDQRDGEYLWGSYYTDLAGHTASLAADGTLTWDQVRRLRLTGSLDAFQTGDFRLSGDGEGDRWIVRVEAADVSHTRIAQVLLRDYLREASADLASLSVTGTSSLDAVLSYDGAATEVVGRYRTEGTTLEVPTLQLAVREIAADLPFDLRYPAAAGGTPSPAAPGFLQFRRLQRRDLGVDEVRIPLRIAANALEVPEPVTIAFLGGQVRVSEVWVDDLLEPARCRLGVTVEGVDLGLLTRRLLGREYPGVVDADLGAMTCARGRIGSGGRVVVRAFGGEIEATQLFAEDVLSSGRKLGGDIAFREISLEEVTRDLAVGKMSGIVHGSLDDFSLEYGQPASGLLEIESVERRGVEQWISVEAIQSISILGTGASGALTGGLTRFFKYYPYRKIGVRCALRNDQLTIRGTIHEGGTEYLVRRGFLRGVDVVNQNPDNAISFKDMQERIGRIRRRPGVEAGGAGPER
jgi:hypothetical protein